ncbi:MAG: class I SAM-dependent methyltransferase [Planctomycetes bacterium]|nr:class I SAM-dependent methyltransferase [Planctomycetota bacterium]
MRGRLRPPIRLLDVGCGDGRNLEPFLRARAEGGYEIHGIDASAEAVSKTRALAAALAPSAPPANFRINGAEDLDPLRDGTFDAVLCIAVLHFARDRAHFDAMLRGLWSVVRPGGLLFVRLATKPGPGIAAVPLGHGRYKLGDGSERFLVEESDLVIATTSMGATLLDPLKTVQVDGQRAMTTWVLRRPG